MSFHAIVLACAGLACVELHDPAHEAGLQTQAECRAALGALRGSVADRLEQIFGVSVDRKKVSAVGLCREGDGLQPAPEARETARAAA